MSGVSSIVRSVHFADEVDCAVYTPEPISPASSHVVPSSPGPHSAQRSSDLAVDQNSVNHYRDGIHTELREPSVIFDLDGQANLADLFDKSILDASATAPHVPLLIVSSHSFPWRITVSPSSRTEVITVQDVLYGIMNNLQRPATNELVDLKRADRDQYREVESRRKSRVEKGNLKDISARWIDWLPSEERVFLGLSSEQGSLTDATERILKVRKWPPSSG